MVCAASVTVAAPSEQRWSDWGEPQRILAMSANFDSAPGVELSVDVDDSDVTVRTGGNDEVRIEIWVVTHDLDAAQDRFERMNFNANGNDRRVELRSDRRRDDNWSWRRHGTFGIDIEILAPARLVADLRTADGDVAIERMEGTVRVQTGDGDVIAESLSGDIELRTQDGDIGVTDLSGEHLLLVTADGDVVLGGVDGPELTVSTSDGDISGARLAAARMQLGTTDGDIVIQSVAGALDARTNDGDIHVAIDHFADTSLTTGDGDITIRAAANLSAQLDVQGSHLSVHGPGDFQRLLDGTFNRRMARGRLNAGGPALRAHTRDGTIVLSLDESS